MSYIIVRWWVRMSLLRYKEIQQIHDNYVVPYTKYWANTWEDEISKSKSHYNIYMTSLLFPDVMIKNKDDTAAFIFAGIGDYVRHFYSVDVHSTFAHDYYIIPRRVKRFSHERESYVEHWRENR